MKKLLQGDACWSTQKAVLGWELDTTTETLRLPSHDCLDRLYMLLDVYPHTLQCVPLTEWHQLLGKLHSMAAALRRSRGLFSTLQNALHLSERSRVHLTRRTFGSLQDFCAIADSPCHRPKRFRELVHLGDPNAYGACDACRRFMGGGLWFLPGRPPLVWQAAFQPVIQRNVVTGDNKKAGTISISGDLELSATLAHTYALTQVTDTTERPVCWLAGDNRASLAWASEGSFTASTTRAYLLLRHSSLHQHFFCYVPQFDDIPGPANVMANDASRRWDLLDTELLSHTSTLCTPSRSQLGLL